MLALAKPARAKIIYTPAYRNIEINEKLPLDLNHDRKNDFLFSDTFMGGDTMPWGGVLWVDPVGQGNGIWGYKQYGATSAFALPAGVRVGEQRPFYGSPNEMAGGSSANQFCWGAWANVKHRYLGLKFISKGKTHFGWARLNVSCDPLRGDVTALLTGYAYETIPNKPIIAGKTKGPDVITLEPGSLGALAAGASRLHRGK